MVKGDIICPRTRSALRLRGTHTAERGAQQEDHKRLGSIMLKPQQPGELLLHDSPPVFGKPWYWQRNSSTMESTRSLAQVIMEMRDEIKKLEAENRELRGDYDPRSFGALQGEASPVSTAGERERMEENPYLNLRRNASAPVLEGQYKGKKRWWH